MLNQYFLRLYHGRLRPRISVRSVLWHRALTSASRVVILMMCFAHVRLCVSLAVARVVSLCLIYFMLTLNLPMDMHIAELFISDDSAKKLNVKLSILQRTIKLDTSVETNPYGDDSQIA